MSEGQKIKSEPLDGFSLTYPLFRRVGLQILPDFRENVRRQYLLGLVLVTAVTLFCHQFSGLISQENLMLLYLVSVILAALYLGQGPTLMVAVTSFVMLVFGILDPQLAIFDGDVLDLDWSSRHFDGQFVGSLLIFLFVGSLVSGLASHLRRQALIAQQEERNVRSLLKLSQDLSLADNTTQIIRVLSDNLREVFSLDCYVCVQQGAKLESGGATSKLSKIQLPKELQSGALFSAEERVALETVLRAGQAVGAFTKTYTFLNATFYPIKTARQVLGVIRISPLPGHAAAELQEGPERNDQSRLYFESLCNQAALAIEQLQSMEQTRLAELRAETERLQSSILNSISHDLQTPLASISGSLQLLMNQTSVVDAQTQQSLLQLAADQTQRLRRLVSNLLQITRLEGGGLRLNIAVMDAGEILDVVRQTAPDLFRSRLRLEASDPYLEFEVDGVLWMSVLMNLLENAAKYSPSNCPVELHIELSQRSWPGAPVVTGSGEGTTTDLPLFVEFAVMDRGAGVPDELKDKIFERFFRMDAHQQAVGSGLGLYITRAIVEAHGGRLWVEDRPEGGSIFIAQVPQHARRSASGESS